MDRTKRLVATFLALALVCTSPGLAPYRALAEGLKPVTTGPASPAGGSPVGWVPGSAPGSVSPAVAPQVLHFVPGLADLPASEFPTLRKAMEYVVRNRPANPYPNQPR